MIRLKNQEQINGIRKSCHLLYETFQFLKEEIKPGISTWDIDKIAEEYIRKNKGVPAFKGYGGFPGTVCTSNNESVIHGIPSKKYKLNSGDLIGLDIGIILDGYVSDSAYTFPVGKITTEEETLLKVTEEALYKGIEQCVAGNRIKDIGKAITKHIEPHGFGIVYQYCGHGVGLEVHEEPQIFNNYPSSGPNPRIKPGMVLAIEPMITIGDPHVEVLEDEWTVVTEDNSKTAHFEHTVAVFEDRTEILTKI